MKYIYRDRELRTTLNSVILDIFARHKEGQIELILTSIL